MAYLYYEIGEGPQGAQGPQGAFGGPQGSQGQVGGLTLLYQVENHLLTAPGSGQVALLSDTITIAADFASALNLYIFDFYTNGVFVGGLVRGLSPNTGIKLFNMADGSNYAYYLMNYVGAGSGVNIYNLTYVGSNGVMFADDTVIGIGLEVAGVQGPAGPYGFTGVTGPQGAAGTNGSNGNDGPNTVSNTTSTSLNGMMYGNGLTVLSDANMTTDGVGSLTASANITAGGVLRSTGGGLDIQGGSTSLDAGNITTDGSGNLTMTGGNLIVKHDIDTAYLQVIGSVPEFIVAGGLFVIDASGNLLLGANITCSGLATTDPHVVGQLWNNSGVLSISAG